MNLDTVSDYRPTIDINVLPYDAAFADLCALHDVREMPDLCARTDLGAFINIGRFMYEVRQLLLLTLDVGGFYGNSAAQQRTLTRVQHSQDPQAFRTVTQRRSSGPHTVEEMLAFRP